MSTHILITSFGPINEVSIRLTKVTIFIGKQSSGKSTIAKVISYCKWLEKRYFINKDEPQNIDDTFIKFHRIDRCYFSTDTYIKYESDALIIEITHGDEFPTFTRKNRLSYQKSKNIYIPSERNFISTIPNLKKYKEANDNIMSFIFDWYTAKNQFSSENDILHLGVSYQYDKKQDQDILTITNSGKEKTLPLGVASSGFQSVIPLVVVFEYLAKTMYKDTEEVSIEELQSVNNELLAYKNLMNTYSLEKNKNLQGEELHKLQQEILAKFKSIQDITNYQYTSFIIEEPEQNLFPVTQRDLIYYLLKLIQESEHDHELLITTHSPYILNSLNNCMMGFLISTNPELDVSEFPSYGSWIAPENVSLWQIEDGSLIDLSDPDTGLLKNNDFNDAMNIITHENLDMMDYFSYEA